MPDLTPRERQVARMIADGMSTREIATALGTSYSTVRAQRGFLMRLLGVKNVAQLIRALRAGK